MFNFTAKLVVGIVALALVVVGFSFFTSEEGDLADAVDQTTFTNPVVFEEATGTSTVVIQSKVASKGGCLMIEQVDGSGYVYVIGTAAGSLATTTTCD